MAALATAFAFGAGAANATAVGDKRQAHIAGAAGSRSVAVVQEGMGKTGGLVGGMA